MIGLAGAHRTGKTSLARECSRALGLPFAETTISQVFQRMGIDPAAAMDFETRIIVQSVILKVCIETWQGYKGAFLSDRTPIDLLAHTMVEIQGTTLNATTESLTAKYFADCIKAANDYFGLIVLVQPGIPIVPAPGKGALSRGYMEHLNTLMSGILIRKDVQAETVFIRRDTLDMQARVDSVSLAYKRMISKQVQLSAEVNLWH